MEKEQQLVEDLVTKAEAYTKTTYELSKLKLLSNSSTIIASAAAIAVAVVLLLISLLLLSMGLGFFLGEVIGRTSYGFFAVGGGYIIIALCCYFFMSAGIKKSVSKSLKDILFA